MHTTSTRVGGYEALTGIGGAAGLEILMRDAVDCVNLELEMPSTDGFEVLRTMRQRGLDTPVIVREPTELSMP